MHMKNAKNGDPTIFTNGRNTEHQKSAAHFGPWHRPAPQLCEWFLHWDVPRLSAEKMVGKKTGHQKMFFGKMTLINGSSCMSCMSLKSFPTTYCNLIKCVDQACTCSVMFGLKTPSRGLSMGLETNQNSVCGYVLGVGQNNPEEAKMMLYQKSSNKDLSKHSESFNALPCTKKWHLNTAKTWKHVKETMKEIYEYIIHSTHVLFEDIQLNETRES